MRRREDSRSIVSVRGVTSHKFVTRCECSILSGWNARDRDPFTFFNNSVGNERLFENSRLPIPLPFSTRCKTSIPIMEYLEFRINLWKSRDFTRGGKDNHRSTSKLIQPSEVNRFQLGYKGTKVISRAVPFIIRSDRRGNSRLELPRIIIFPLSA